MKNLTLNPNLAPQLSEPSPSNTELVWPLTTRDMNGAQPFIYLSTLSTPKECENTKGKAKTITTDPLDVKLELCPECGKIEDAIMLNPSQAEEDVMWEAMEHKCLPELVKKPKSSKKQKNDLPTDNTEHPVKKWGRAGRYPWWVKWLWMGWRWRKQSVSRRWRCSEELVWEQDKEKETFMTIGTFTRVRLFSGFEYNEAHLIQSNMRRSTSSSLPNITSKQTTSRNSRRNHHPSVQTGLDVDVWSYTIFILSHLKLRREFLVSTFPLQLLSPTTPKQLQFALMQLWPFCLHDSWPGERALCPTMKLKSLQWWQIVLEKHIQLRAARRNWGETAILGGCELWYVLGEGLYGKFLYHYCAHLVGYWCCMQDSLPWQTSQLQIVMKYGEHVYAP